ncbi:hypothetical protein INR49_001659 [Caranx melampygus]|nr:hypothetical protein INR49_001659 [Caranx melampygus]
METRGPFNPKLPSQYSSAPAPKPSAPPPTAPKPALSFLPPPEMGDRPPPAPWAEELKARTNRQANHNSAPNSAAPPFSKAPAVAPKSGVAGRMGSSSASLAQKLNQNLNQIPAPISVAPKPSPSSATSSFPPPPAAPPAPPTPPSNMAAPLASNHVKSSPFASQANANQKPPSAVPPPQPKMMASPPSSFNHPMKSPPSSSPSPPGPVHIPGGGVPLNMREVEELERMTKDFIKDMDTNPPVITSPPTEVCGKCGEALSRTQPAVRAMDKLFHSNCFCCMSCHRPLQGMQFYDRDGSPQCEDCYMSSLAVCSRCGERITDRVLKAVGQCFHAHCFRCSTCSCILEGAPFITDDNNNPYCVQDYHRRFSPLCVSCNEPIVPAPGSEETVRVVALDKNFHLKCYRCEDCARPLSIEADENGCYPLDGRILCMKCHTQRAKRAAHLSCQSSHCHSQTLRGGFHLCLSCHSPPRIPLRPSNKPSPSLRYNCQRPTPSTNTKPTTPCLSLACQWASARLSTSADPFKEPCDYFLFTCRSDRFTPDGGGRQRGQGIPGHPQNQNGWPQSTRQSQEREDRGVRQETRLDRKTVLLQYLRQILESNDKGGSSAVQKAKGFYSSCLDTRAIETAGVKPFLTLTQKLGGWPASGQWNKTDFNSTLSLLMRDYATFPFFNLYKLRPFLASCEQYLALLGAPPSSSMLHVGMFMSLSSELAVTAAPLQYRLARGQLYQRMTIRELQIQAPAIDWLGCLRATFHPLALMEDDFVLVHNLPYMVQMSPIIRKWLNKHELSTSGPLQTYMVLNLLHTLMPALDSRFSETANNLSVALGDTDGAEEMIDNIFSSFKSKLHELNWTDKTALQSVMKKVSVSSDSFFSNYIQILSLWQKRRRKLLTQQTEEADAYHRSLKSHPVDTSISGLSHTHLFLSSFSQVNCDFDPYHEFMPLEPSFLITVICANSHLCPSSLQCPRKTQQHSLQTC